MRKMSMLLMHTKAKVDALLWSPKLQPHVSFAVMCKLYKSECVKPSRHP